MRLNSSKKNRPLYSFGMVMGGFVVVISAAVCILAISYLQQRNISQSPLTTNNLIAELPASTPGATNSRVPNSPPDLTSGEAPCIGTYLGVPEGDEQPTPTRVPASACRKVYAEEHLEFSYPCAWKVVPMVEKEISHDCGRIREFYLLEGDRQIGMLYINPDGNDSSLTSDTEYYGECTPITMGKYTLTECKMLNRFKAINIFGEDDGIGIYLAHGNSDYEADYRSVLTSLKLKYPHPYP